ncbi:MAG TPA: acyltransferase family protein [Longimicrobium sp.]|nr:acyltransferase family protein [Longimicrobium sp.]
MHGTRYRADIDGLRAVAVLLVMAYHFGIGAFRGGYVGVDVFFVISGFLITQILMDDAADGHPRLGRFYARRVRRIAPALCVVLVAVTVAAFLLFLPRQLVAYGRSVISSVLMVPNLYFFSLRRGYFDPVAETHPLLHLWSLGVEEQFYLLYPLYVWVIMRWDRRHAIAITAVLLALSLGLYLWAIPRMPNVAFFLPAPRAWELLAGALLALSPPSFKGLGRLAGAGGVVGLALILAVATGYGEAAPAGTNLLLAVSGSLLLIAAGSARPDALVPRLLSLRPLVSVGLISYSLYLWHWPIYVFLRHSIVMEPLRWDWMLAGMLASLAIAAASWHFLEQPVRQRRLLRTTPRVLAATATVMGGLLLAGSVLNATGGLPREAHARVDPLPTKIQKGRSAFPCSAQRFARDAACRPAGSVAPAVLWWGDSFANHYWRGLAARQGELSFNPAMHTMNGCAPILGAGPASRAECERHNGAGLRMVERHRFRTVILSGRWEKHASRDEMVRLTATVRALRAAGARVLVIGQSPVFHFYAPDEYLYRRSGRGPAPVEASAALAIDPGLNDRLRGAVRDGGGLFFDPLPALCQEEACLYRAGGRYLVDFESHLTAEGAERIVRRLLVSEPLRALLGS